MGKLSIDYEIVQLTMPMMYLGTLFGVKIGTMLSELALAVSLALVLLFMAYTTVIKAIDLYKKETIEKQKKLQEK
jgi:uncharacterized membrane protein YfcA